MFFSDVMFILENEFKCLDYVVGFKWLYVIDVIGVVMDGKFYFIWVYNVG